MDEHTFFAVKVAHLQTLLFDLNDSVYGVVNETFCEKSLQIDFLGIFWLVV
jgi:hypothetical protein